MTWTAGPGSPAPSNEPLPGRLGRLFGPPDRIETLRLGAGVRALEPRAKDLLGHRGRGEPEAQREDVRVVPRACAPRRLRIDAKGSPNAANLVGGDANTRPGVAAH